MVNDKFPNRSKVILSVFRVLSGVNPECQIDFHPKGLNIVSIDENFRCMAIVHISSKFFSNWKVRKSYRIKTNIDLLKKIFSYKPIIKHIRSRTDDVIEVSFSGPVNASLMLNVTEIEKRNRTVPAFSKKMKLLSLKLPSSRDFANFLKISLSAFDDLHFILDSNGNLQLCTKFLDYTLVKRIAISNFKRETPTISFSIPMRYASLLLPLLGLVDKLRLDLIRNNLCVFTMGKKGFFQIKLILSSKINDHG